jgi:alpha-L-arabinofuranosidase
MIQTVKAAKYSVHMYTSFGPRDRSQKELEYYRTVYGPSAAEHNIKVARGIIDKACVEYITKTRTHPSVVVTENTVPNVGIAFDEWGVWDETVGEPININTDPISLLMLVV